VNRKGLIVGSAALTVIALLVIAGIGLVWFLLIKKTPPQVYKRAPVAELAYCNSDNLKPCIVSFSVDADSNMLVNMLIPTASYPDFYLTISKDNIANKYECQPVDDFPTNIYCTGIEMYPGEALQFTLFAVDDDTVLAEGKFAIIGLLLPNPGGEVTATPSLGTPAEITETPSETPTPPVLEILTPIATKPISITPTPTELITAYPNPGYP